jgi:hypothetical protein
MDNRKRIRLIFSQGRSAAAPLHAARLNWFNHQFQVKFERESAQ